MNLTESNGNNNNVQVNASKKRKIDFKESIETVININDGLFPINFNDCCDLECRNILLEQ